MMKNVFLILLGIMIGAFSFYFFEIARGKNLRANLIAELAEYCQNFRN